MNATTQINQRLQLLPSELQEEVLQFIEYLLFKKKAVESKAENGNVVTPPCQPAHFSWAGALKGKDEGMNSVEWQHRINELMTETSKPATHQ